MRGTLLLALCACSLPAPPVCTRWVTKRVDAFEETTPRVFMCAIYKCGAVTVRHEAHDERVCEEYK